MNSVCKYLRLYLEFAKQNFKIMLEYRVNFIIGALSTFFMQATGILFVWIIFNNINTLKGWSFYEITFVYGLMSISKGINHIFFDNLWILGNHYINLGKFDTLMLRPISPLFHLIADKIQQDGFGTLFIGIIVTIKSIVELKLIFSTSDIFMLMLFITSGTIIFFAINLITSTSSFWTVNSGHFIWSIFMNHEFALYPLDIYHKFIGIILTWFIPYAFVSFYPANFFFQKGYQQLSLLSPVIAIFLLIISFRVWNFGLAHYDSTGS